MANDTRHKYLQLILGFLLTGGMGSWLTNCYQANAREREAMEVRRTAAMAVIDTVSHILNRGYYTYSRMYDLAVGNEVDTGLVHSAFEVFNSEFESRWYADAGRVCAHFGVEIGDRFVEIGRRFQHINPQLREAVRLASPGDPSMIYRFRNDVYALTMDMVATLDDAAAGIGGLDCNRVPFDSR